MRRAGLPGPVEGLAPNWKTATFLIIASNLSPGRLCAVSSYLKDAIDAGAILEILGSVKQENSNVVQVFAKAEADPIGDIRGNRHTILTDSDLPSTRHAQATVDGLVAGLVSEVQVAPAFITPIL